MKNTQAAGAARERQVVRAMQDRGYVAFRVGGHSANRGKVGEFDCCDVIAFKAADSHGNGYGPVSEVWLIEVKANTGSPWKSFRPLDRRTLKITADVAGATALLVHYPPHGEYREYPVSAWP